METKIGICDVKNEGICSKNGAPRVSSHVFPPKMFDRHDNPTTHNNNDGNHFF